MNSLSRPSSPLPSPLGGAARVSFRQPVSEIGVVDAAWWPRSRGLLAELPALFDVLWTACRDVDRVGYNRPFWEPVPRRMRVDDVPKGIHRTRRYAGLASSKGERGRNRSAKIGTR